MAGLFPRKAGRKAKPAKPAKRSKRQKAARGGHRV